MEHGQFNERRGSVTTGSDSCCCPVHLEYKRCIEHVNNSDKKEQVYDKHKRENGFLRLVFNVTTTQIGHFVTAVQGGKPAQRLIG